MESDSVVRTAGIGGAEPTYTGRWARGFIAGRLGRRRRHAARSIWRLIAACSPCRWAKGVVFCYADIASAHGRPIWDWRSYFNDLRQADHRPAGPGQGIWPGSPIMEVDAAVLRSWAGRC